MRFVSTRGAGATAGFIDVLLAGLAPDGGLYAPAEWPRLTAEEIAAFAGAPYPEVAAAVLGRFTGGEIATPDLAAICHKAYASFAHPAVAPVTQLAPGRFLLELFHGPTLAFKDVAMQVLGGLFEHALAARGRTMTIVCATSGDTGGAAAAAFAGRTGVRLVILYPEGRISEVQRRFMTATGADNVACLAVKGDFDACQGMLKALFIDEAFVEDVSLAAVNSINFARIAAQIVYYFTAAVALGAPAREVSFAVPTGNFGDAYAGWAARRMGAPIERLIIATNANDILPRALNDGDYRRGQAIATSSPAMDIQVASNFERLFFEYAGRDASETGAAFAAFAREGAFTLPGPMRAAMGEVFTAVSVSEDEAARTMAATFAATGELVDPHTAVALAAAQVSPLGATPLVVLATAHPAKFPAAVEAATGVAPPVPAIVAALAERQERSEPIAADAEAVKAFVRGMR
ncbi:MAG TPA: threonine synthase [Caulobacteraceae bacterium]|nr:threonine synthase [Caulobacteraceae bacterium]